MLKLIFIIISLSFFSCSDTNENDETKNVPDGFTGVFLQSEITKVQPMTGIVLWDDSDSKSTDAVSLEYAYIKFSDIINQKDVYDWSYLDAKLDAIKSRNHQAIFRMYYVYPGEETTVPQYIKERSDYTETVGTSEGKTTYFPDWRNSELHSFNLEFHTKFAERYNNDPRLAFLQVGFGLWGEYHIYDGPKILGTTFPNKTYQAEFLNHMNTTYTNLRWSISIDSYDENYSPLKNEPNLTTNLFGLFDDSFMHKDHGLTDSNESWWEFFNYSDRYKTVPFGGEFSYYTDNDQQNVLKPNVGAHGISYESFAKKFHITYMIGNDQPSYHPLERIKEASMASGYSYEVTDFLISDTVAKISVKNTGIAPIYYDAFVTVNGTRSLVSLKTLFPDEIKEYTISFSETIQSTNLSIESDKILDTQEIQFNANLNY